MSLQFKGHNKPEPQWNALLATGAHTISGRLDTETLKRWMRHAEFWIYFCTLYRIGIHAFVEIYLIAFCCWKVSHTDIAWSGLRGYLYGIKECSIQCGKPISITATSMPSLSYYLKGRRKQKPSGNGKGPFTDELILEWFDRIYCVDIKKVGLITAYNNQCWRALWSTQYCAQQRNETMTREDIGGVRHFMIEWPNGTLEPLESDSYFVLHFHKSKTNTTGEHQTCPIFCFCGDATREFLNPEDTEVVCGFCEMRKFYAFKKKPLRDEDVVFKLFGTGGDEGIVIDYNMCRNQVQKMERKLEIKRGTYGTHSARSGGEAKNRQRGFSDTTRMGFAGWKSAASLFYYARKASKEAIVAIAKEELTQKLTFHKLMKCKGRNIMEFLTKKDLQILKGKKWKMSNSPNRRRKKKKKRSRTNAQRMRAIRKKKRLKRKKKKR